MAAGPGHRIGGGQPILLPLQKSGGLRRKPHRAGSSAGRNFIAAGDQQFFDRGRFITGGQQLPDLDHDQFRCTSAAGIRTRNRVVKIESARACQ